MFNTPDFGDVLDRLAVLLADGELTVEIAGRYDLEEVAQAQRDVLAESALGKLVVVP